MTDLTRRGEWQVSRRNETAAKDDIQDSSLGDGWTTVPAVEIENRGGEEAGKERGPVLSLTQ